MRLEDYALLGDLQSAALVGNDGSVDWLCVPRFDSPACFAALVGEEEHGRWRVAPSVPVTHTTRRYRPGTLVLETDFETADGAVRLIDFTPRRGDAAPRLMRIVEGLSGQVPMRSELRLRPDYGSVRPWVESAPDGVVAVACPEAFRLSTPVALEMQNGLVAADSRPARARATASRSGGGSRTCRRPRSRTPTRRSRVRRRGGVSGRRAAPTTASTGTPC